MPDEVPLRNIIASKNISPADGNQWDNWDSTNHLLLINANRIERQNNIFDEHYF